MIGFILVAQLAAGSPPPRVEPPVNIDSAGRAAERFIRTWRFYWESSESYRNNYALVYEFKIR